MWAEHYANVFMLVTLINESIFVCMYVCMQLSVSVSLVLMTAMSMHCALTEMEALTVSALLVTLAMKHTVLVRCSLHVYHV